MKTLGIGSALILILLFAVLLVSCGGSGSQYYQVPSGGVTIDVDGHKRPKPAPGVKPKAPTYKAPSFGSGSRKR